LCQHRSFFHYTNTRLEQYVGHTSYQQLPNAESFVLSKIHRILTFGFLYPHAIINIPQAIEPSEIFCALTSELKKNSTTKSGLQIIISLTNVTAATTKNNTPIAVFQFLPRRVYSSLIIFFIALVYFKQVLCQGFSSCF